MTVSPRAIQRLAVLPAVATLATLAWGAWMTFGSGPIVWGMFGFEVVIAAAAISALAFSWGILPESPALTLACIALAVLVSAGLGLIATGLLPGPVLRHPLFLTRFAVVTAFAALAVLAALGDHRRAWRSLIQGGALTVVSAGALLAGYRLMGSISLGPGVGQLLLIIVGVLAGVACMGALCVGAHMLIRAFEIAADRSPASASGSMPDGPSRKPPSSESQ